jgi:hypothetical protein
MANTRAGFGTIYTQKSYRALLLVLAALVLVSHLSGGYIFVDSAVERAELYSGTCLSIDSDCHLNDNATVRLGGAPSSTLNLFAHLFGTCQRIASEIFCPADLASVYVAIVRRLPHWVFATQIFHPPKI